MQIERNLGADVIMQFDHVIPGQSATRARRATPASAALRWLERCRVEFERLEREHADAAIRAPQALFPIVQGGIHADLRREAARAIRGAGRLARISESAGSRSARPSPTCTRMLDVVDAELPARPPALSHGRRLSRGPRRGRAARRRPLRLRGADAHGTQRHRVHRDGRLNIKRAGVPHRSASASTPPATAPPAAASRAPTSGTSS